MGVAGGADEAGASRIQTMDSDSCLLLLRSVAIGRLAWSTADLEAVVIPVNFALDGRTVVVKTTRGGELVEAVEAGRTLTFEADDMEPALRTGWSVLVTGRAELVTDPGVVHYLERLRLAPWARLPDPLFVRLVPERVTGRRLPMHPGGVTAERLDEP
uniref:pyridoxamine 5'-phosphate oxidase family protein n=1 Tax=Nonomuraea pusilla TaxID=46177 RepID=UPI0006E2179F|nr:pyridoxamine 5'-phosphate oxidase family protein [Nonomuraea pusilla]